MSSTYNPTHTLITIKGKHFFRIMVHTAHPLHLVIGCCFCYIISMLIGIDVAISELETNHNHHKQSLLFSWSTLQQQPIVRMWNFKNLKAKKCWVLKHSIHESFWVHGNWSPCWFLIFQVFCWTHIPNTCHPIPFSPSLHVCIKWCEWGFASPHLSLCMCKYHAGWSQCPKTECKTYKILSD